MSGSSIISCAKIATLALMPLLFACSKGDAVFSDVPQIEFLEIQIEQDVLGKDSMVLISFSFQDGDGDIGLGDTDTDPPFNFGNTHFQNLPIEIQYNNGGVFEELLNPSNNQPFQLHERIPRITPEGKNKAITGKITVSVPANPGNTRPGQVRYKLQLEDRKLHSSNIITTPSITLIH